MVITFNFNFFSFKNTLSKNSLVLMVWSNYAKFRKFDCREAPYYQRNKNHLPQKFPVTR